MRWLLPRSTIVNRPASLLALIALALASPSLARAQDPVEKLRQALLLGSDKGESPELINERAELLKASVKEITTIGQLRRAYLLKEWALHPRLDAEAPAKPGDVDQFRIQIGKSFTEAVRRAAVDADPMRRLAVAFVIAELAEGDQSTERKGRGKFARTFAEEVRKLATDADSNVRRAGLYALGKITPKPADAVPTLRHALAKDELAPRRIAAHALIDLVKHASYLRVSDEEKEKRKNGGANEELHTIEQVIAAAAIGVVDADELVRGYSLQASFEAVKALNDYLDSTVAYPIGQVLDTDLKATFDTIQKTTPQALQALQDPHINVRLTALLGLDQVGVARAKIAQRLRDLNPGKRPPTGVLFEGVKTADPFRNLVKSEWRTIVQLLHEPDARLRRGAIDLIEQLSDELPAVEPELARALRDDDRMVRWTAARTLRNIPAKDVSRPAVAALARLVMDEDPDVSVAAAITLQGIGKPAADAIDALPEEERAASLDALSLAVTNGGRTAAPNRDVETRLLAMRVLVSLGGNPARHSIPRLIEALTDPDARVRRAAAETLGQFGPGARDALPALRAALRDEHSEVRLMASEAILSIDPPKKGL